MAELTLAKVYARALFDVAKEKHSEEQFLEEIEFLGELTKTSEEFRLFLASPMITVKEKKDILEGAFSERLSEEVMNFLMILLDKGKCAYLWEISRSYRSLVNEENRVSEGIVTSCEELGEERTARLQEQLEKLFNKRIVLTNVIDSSLVGGITVQLDGKFIDRSFKTQLDRMREKIVQ